MVVIVRAKIRNRQSSSGSLVTKLQARMVRGLNLSGGARNFLSSKTSIQVLGPTQPFIQCVPAFFTEGKASKF
jgi:hypothetical protein